MPKFIVLKPVLLLIVFQLQNLDSSFVDSFHTSFCSQICHFSWFSIDLEFCHFSSTSGIGFKGVVVTGMTKESFFVQFAAIISLSSLWISLTFLEKYLTHIELSKFTVFKPVLLSIVFESQNLEFSFVNTFLTFLSSSNLSLLSIFYWSWILPFFQHEWNRFQRSCSYRNDKREFICAVCCHSLAIITLKKPNFFRKISHTHWTVKIRSL